LAKLNIKRTFNCPIASATFSVVSDLGAKSTHITSESKQACFGDLHIHIAYRWMLLRAVSVQRQSTPNNAYCHTKGEAIPHPAGSTIENKGNKTYFLKIGQL
jgi:hypothetical protein